MKYGTGVSYHSTWKKGNRVVRKIGWGTGGGVTAHGMCQDRRMTVYKRFVKKMGLKWYWKEKTDYDSKETVKLNKVLHIRKCFEKKVEEKYFQLLETGGRGGVGAFPVVRS